MNENQTTANGSAEQLLDQLKRLRRSRSDKVIAGVCGGLGRSLGVDPLLIRIVVAVLAVFGAGVVLYALAWLLLPVDDGTPSVGAQALQRGEHTRSSTVWLAVVLAIAVAIGVAGAVNRWDGPILLTLAVGGLIVWLLRRQPAQAPTQAPAQAPAQAPTVSVPYGVPPSAPTATAAASGPADAPTTVLPPTEDAGSLPEQPPLDPEQPPVPPQPPYAAGPPVPPPPPVPPQPPRPTSHLFGLTVSVALIALGLLAAFDVAGAQPPDGAYPALALTVVGLGLVLGTWFGRARGLVFWGIVLSLATLVGSVAGHARGLNDNAVDQTVTVSTVSALPTDDRYGAGQVEYDLTGLDLSGQTATMDAQIGFGEIVVVVPPDLDVVLDARTGVGGLTLFGSDTGGLNQHRQRTDYGADGPGGGTLDLTLYAGFGHLEVRRAAS
ncbi:MAG TPA: PspC domain-containing protein [Angustibacter sp.]|nr:PspC domain-containing protein [Angustibacter sp.]